MIKINGGSGQRPFLAPWINLDCRKQDYSVDILTDLKDLNMFEDNSVDIICLHHVFEHIPIHELEVYITEWYRVLKEDGKILICVPNLRELDKAWLEGKISTFIHNVNTFGAWQGYDTDLHKWGYDPQELYNRMCCYDENSKTIKFNWKNPQIPDLNSELYLGADVAVDWYILLMELTK